MVFSLRPVVKGKCYWQKELDTALASIDSDKNFVVFAPEKLGKSTFLHQLSDNIKKTRIPLLFSSENCLSISAYIRKNLPKVFRAYPKIFGKDPEKMFDFSLLALDRRIADITLGRDAKEALKLLLVHEHDSRIDMADVVLAFFRFPSLLTKETRTKPVVMLDDAEELCSLKSGQVSLSMVFQMIPELDAVFVISTAKRDLIKDMPSLFLLPFDRKTAGVFIADCGLKLKDDAMDALYEYTAGFPFYLNFFARLMLMSGITGSAKLNEFIEDSLANELNLYFSERLKHLSPKELPILFCMAEHDVNTPSKISRLLDYSQTNVRRFLTIMEEKQFVAFVDRGVFEIYDPVFKKWLQMQSGV